jgi:hypothetical protein
MLAVPADEGSEFMADFEVACSQRHIRLFILSPHSPKLNMSKECGQATYRFGAQGAKEKGETLRNPKGKRNKRTQKDQKIS